jgi:mono/diheme cytochrome c family protein
MQPRKHENTKTGVVALFGWVVSCVVIMLVGPARSGFGGTVQTPDRGDIDRGKQTFTRVGCYQCHGREAQGASTGPRLGPNPLPLAAFTRAVRIPRNDMPPYSNRILSDSELADVYAFVAARPRPRLFPR